MKIKLLLGMLLVSLGLSAQTTHHLDWFMGVTSTDASLAINQGDIVTWTVTDNLPHTITSNAGAANSFNSGNISGNGQTFSHTFANAGVSSYKCNVHAMMQGTITASAVAGVIENNKMKFEYFPNPTTDVLTINAGEIIDNIEIYDSTGRQVMNSKSGNATSKIYMANYTAGTYFVKVSIGDKTENITVIKK